MDNEKLNEKLAIWRGFKFVDKPRYFTGFPGAAVACHWITPDDVETPYSPNFASDLTACFKWLVPNLEASGLASVFSGMEFNVGNKGEEAWQCILYTKNGSNYTEGYAETPALSLCLAIEKLIEAEK